MAFHDITQWNNCVSFFSHWTSVICFWIFVVFLFVCVFSVYESDKNGGM